MSKLSPEQVSTIKRMVREGEGPVSIADAAGCSLGAVQYYKYMAGSRKAQQSSARPIVTAHAMPWCTREKLMAGRAR